MNKPTGKQIGGLIAAIVVAGGLVTAGWTLDEHWTTRKLHEITKKQIYADMSQFQRDLRVQRAMDSVNYWLRIELEMQNACDRYPNDINLKRKYERAKLEREKAERYLREVQRRN